MDSRRQLVLELVRQLRVFRRLPYQLTDRTYAATPSEF